jgi:hypothetical protein
LCTSPPSKKKDITDISKAKKKKAPVARATTLRYFITTDQLSDITKSHAAKRQAQEWVRGDFSFAAAGEEIPAKSLELSIKVPSGLNFLLFPNVLKLEGGVVEEEMGEEHEVEESSDSELSECGYVSDVRI